MKRRPKGFIALYALIIGLFAPGRALAQQLPPSVTLLFDTGESGHIGVTVETGEPGPNVADLSAFFAGDVVQPAALAESSEVTVEPMFDEEEFPDGPARTRLTFSPVTLPAGQSFLPGFVGFIVPDRIGSELTPESFLETMLADYTLEINGVKFMDDDLFTPDHVTWLGPFDGALVGFPGQTVHIWGLNITTRITQPGTYVIRNIIRFPKTVPVPELGVTYLGGELIVQVTVNIVAASATSVPPTNGWKVVGESMIKVQQALQDAIRR